LYVLSCGSGFFVSLLLLVDGWFGLVCMVLLRWVVFITVVSVSLMLAEFSRVHANCFHQIEMRASIKIFFFLPRELRQNRGTCVCLFCVLSKNGFNNGFDIIGLHFSLFSF
jgi:hypothetical protein